MRYLVAVILCLMMGVKTIAQINYGGSPSFLVDLDAISQSREIMPAIDLTQLAQADAVTDQIKEAPWRFGVENDVEYNTSTHGYWTAEGDENIWRIALKGEGATSMSVRFSEFGLEKGAYLFVWAFDSHEFIGKFDHRSRKDWGGLATGIVNSYEIIVEYHQPSEWSFNAPITIDQVVYGYRSLLLHPGSLASSQRGPFGNSGACNINVNCPEGALWAIEKRSVALIVQGGFAACTGALINNTLNDGTPYFLTANHCLGNPGAWLYYFNHESATCDGNTGPTNQSVSGGTTLVSNGASDYALLQLSETPPASFNVQYAGWDASGDTPLNATGIHHPSGDLKKICFEEDSPYFASAGGVAVWMIDQWELGVTEPGSSGSPLFDHNHRIIGQLYGGAAACAGNVNNGQLDYYGRLNESYTLGAAEYLDPTGSGIMAWDGFPDGAVSYVSGCTNPTASNYDPEATEDDGSCTYTGCMDSTACNFNPEATEDDGNCDYSCCPGPGCCNDGTYWDDVTQTCLLDITFCSWQPDSNADGNIGIGDLLDLLSVFGDTDYDEDGVFDSVDDCVDPEACNYQSNPTEPCYYIDVLGICGGGCEADEDGDAICDDIDDCIGVVDECGVCNGPGPTEIVIESITFEYDSVFLPLDDDWYVYEISTDTTFSYTCAFNCGDLVSHDGYDYSTVLIGEQCWFSENCRYLPVVSPSGASSASDPYYYVYDYQGTDVAAAQATTNYATYGVLYNWPAVMTEGICPSGWHIPSDGEFTELTDFLGGESVAGYVMKSTSGWNDYSGNPGNGSNSSGFNGLTCGYRYFGGFTNVGNYGSWWSSSESGSSSWERELSFDTDGVNRYNYHARDYGFSARCVIDYTDECGVLNGDNSTCEDDCGVPNGDNTTCLDECGVPNGDNSTCFTNCGDDIGHEGYDYSTVLIGDQCWFSENCRYLPEVSPSSASSTTEPFYYVRSYEGTDVVAAQATENYETYGVLYNWPAVMTEGICPSGWHVPSDGEFTQLTDFLGGAGVAGGKMKEAGYDHWYSPNTGATNSSGFTGLPGGGRYWNGFNYSEYIGSWWSASESGSDSGCLELSWSNDNGSQYSFGRDGGFSARCVRD